jgi:predicted  nucleic acid-binding Zn-ribbon protein
MHGPWVADRTDRPERPPDSRRDRSKESLSSSKTADERNAIQRQIDVTDKEIDRLVYELYDLTDDEINIVEEATR